MKKLILISLTLFICQFSFSQNLDLIVRTNGDSIACRIDSITDSHIYFEVKDYNKWIETNIFKNLVKEFQYGVINEKLHDFNRGTSYIKTKINIPNYSVENIQSASLRDLNIYLGKAKRIKKTGAGISITGAAFVVLGAGLIATNKETNGYVGIYMGMAGGIIAIVGLPVLFTGSSRIKKIEGIIDSRNTGMSIEIIPSSFQNYITHSYQTGITLRIRF